MGLCWGLHGWGVLGELDSRLNILLLIVKSCYLTMTFRDPLESSLPPFPQ
jgi:hypothetical protein